MRTIVYTGTLRAQTSIAHGSRPSGNNHPFRRETLILPSGKRLAAVPVVSGGTVRGSLRRLAAAMTHQALCGDGTLPHAVVHALRTGGTLRETRTSGECLSGERQALLRDALPMLGIFGLAAGGRIMSGRLQVGKPLPVAQETLYLADHYQTDLTGYEPPSIWQVVQRETYTRHADVNGAAAAPLIDQVETSENTAAAAGNMIYSHETISPGTRLFHTLTLDAGTPAEVSFFDDLVRRWSSRATIGGQIAKGLGRVSTHYTRTCYDILGDPTTEEQPSYTWRDHMQARDDQVKAVLAWL